MITGENILVALLVLAGACLPVALLGAIPRRWTQFAVDEGGSRLPQLDGLRAFLAIGVVTTHVWSYYDYYFSGLVWNWPTNPYFEQCGSLAVPGFFMLTGFLFWSKARRAAGRINPLALYANRARRILPLYYFLCAGVLAIVAVRTGSFSRPSSTTVGQVAGLIVPGLHPSGLIAGTERAYMLAATWSLYPELLFYLAFPAVAIFARSKQMTVFLLVVSPVFFVFQRILNHHFEYSLLCFWAGFFAVEWLERFPAAAARLRGPGPALALLALWVALPLATKGALNPVSFVYTALVFLVVTSGNTLFGAFTSRGARIVGNVSYSVYLLHLIILYVGLKSLNHWFPITAMGVPAKVSLMTALLTLIAGVSLFTFRYVELPWMRRRPRLPAT